MKKRNLRAGTYGDPANIPFQVWDSLYQRGEIDGTGYTHKWRTCDPRFKAYLMASVDNESDARLARSLGWRTYGVDIDGNGADVDAVMCPESTNPGVTCDTCRLCAGARKQAKNVVIPPIGSKHDGQRVSCYVNTGWLTKLWESWQAGNFNAVDPETVGAFIAGKDGKLGATIEAWRGVSPYDGTPIMLLVTGLRRPSANRKTGPMIQTYILSQNERPVDAVVNGNDAAICGECPFRPSLARAA